MPEDGSTPPDYSRSFPIDYNHKSGETLDGAFPGSQTAGFQGLWTDPATGLAYARNRWYDPHNAAWLSEDPIGPVDSSNLYAFVGWGPNSGTDPMGLGNDLNYTPEARKAREKRLEDERLRRYVEWQSNNNEAYAYAKSRRPHLDTNDPAFRGLMGEWFKNVHGDCRDAWILKSAFTPDCTARVNAAFPLSPEGILAARKNNRFYGDPTLIRMGALGQAAENIGMMEAWWAVGTAAGELLPAEGMVNVNRIVDDVRPPSVWELGAGPRGIAIEDAIESSGLRSGRLPPGFRTVDFFDEGIATSTKSIDLGAKTYQDANRLLSTVRKYVDKLRDFRGGARGGFRIRPGDITGRRLDLVIPQGSLTQSQRLALEAAEQYAQGQGISLEILTVN